MRVRALVLPLASLATGCSLDFDKFAQETEADLSFVDAVVPMGGQPVPDFGPGVDFRQDAAPSDAGPGGDTVLPPDAAGNDGDDIPPEQDNCPDIANQDQLDFDRDGQGDACDDDPDGDGLDEAAETAQGTSPRAADSDGDGHSDAMDNCPTVSDRLGLDKDTDGAGDACDPDDDGDMVPDWRDNCPGTVNADQADADANGTGEACAGDVDGDAVADAADVCPFVANPQQGPGGCASLFTSLTYGRDARALATSPDGVAAGTAGGLFDVRADGVTARTTAHGLADNQLDSVFVDAHGRRWATSEGAVSVSRPDGFVFRMGGRDAGGGPQGALRSVAVDASDIVYVSSDTGLSVYSGGTWTLLAPPVIPSADVRGLWLAPTGEVWAATAAGAVRLQNGAANRTVSGVPGVGDALLSVSGEADGTIWLLGENGAAHLPADGSNVPLHTYTGFAARALTVGANGNRYLATPEGLRRVDADGRLFPPGTALLPSGDVRAVAGQPDQPRWVGTAEGVVLMDGYFASFAPEPTTFVRPCVTVSTRVGSLLWVGTDQGLYLVSPDGSHRKIDADLPGQLVKVIRAIGSTVWVGTDAGIALFATDGTATGRLTAAEGIPAAPISDIVAGVNDQVWIASDGNGIARRNADMTFTAFTRESAGNNFLSNAVKALAHDGGTLWIGTDQGVTVFNEGTASFQFPVTNQGGQLPDVRVGDITVGGGLVYVATPQGVAVRRADNTWTTLRRATGGWPNSTGADFARAVAFDGEAAWILLAENQRQPNGVLLRRRGLDPLPENSEGGDTVSVFTPENAGLVASKGSRSVTLEWTGAELFASWCGTDDDVGGYSVLEGRGVVVRDVSGAMGLRGGHGAAALTVGPEGQPLYSAARADGLPAATALAVGANPTDPPLPSDFHLPPAVTGVLRKCAQAPGADGVLWCAIAGVGVGRRLEEQQWVVLTEAQIRDLVGGDVRDIVADAPQSVWVATGSGVLRINQGNPRFYNQAATSDGLPSDDVRAVALGAGGKLYAGTAGGVGIFDPTSMSWTPIRRTPGALGNADVRALAVAGDGSLYIGTADGLFRLGPDGTTFTDFNAARGLPSNDVRAVALHPDGRVIVGTAAGAAVGTPAGADLTFTVAGFADGLPGRAVHDIVVAADGRIWLRSDDGVALLK